MEEEGSELQFLRGGEEYFSYLLDAINKAEVFIHIHMYILGKDKTGERIMNALADAVGRGVDVYLLLDDFGTDWMNLAEEDALLSRGFLIRRFSKRSTTKNFRFGRRLHSKIIIIDNRLGLLGGMNFADRYSGYDGKEAWLDFAVAFKSSAVISLNSRAATYWRKSVRKQLRAYPQPALNQKQHHQILYNDWLRNRAEISREYRNMIRSAKKEVQIIASYFIPGGRMLRIIRNKAREGVKIRILLTAYSDVPFIKSAMEHYYSRLIHEGVEIFEWPESVLHAKLVYADSVKLCIGSYNLNQLSDFSSVETNILIRHQAFVEDVAQRLNAEIYPKTIRITKERRSILVRFKNWLAFAIVRVGLRIAVFFSGRKFLDYQTS